MDTTPTNDPPVVQLVGPSVDDEFLALMCSDEEWLRAEFDAIVAAEWVDPPQPLRPNDRTSRPKARRNHSRTRALVPQEPPIPRRARVRSPPRGRHRRPRK